MYGMITDVRRKVFPGDGSQEDERRFLYTIQEKKNLYPGTSPTDVAGQIRRKYRRRMQVQHSPLSTTARSLLLRKLNDSIERGSTVEPPQLQLLRQRLREDYSQLVVKDYKQERWIVISR